MKKFRRWFWDNIRIIFTIVAIGLLVLAANLDSPSGWLLVSAWGMIVVRVWLWFEDNKENDQKGGPFVLMVIPLFVVAASSQRFQASVIKVLESPTLANLGKLACSSQFLFLVACYFALLFQFAKIKLGKVEDDYDNLKKRRLEEIALYQNELKCLKEKLMAELNKNSSN